MAGDLQPLDEKFPIVGPDGRPTLYFIKWAQQRQIDITGAVTADEALEIVVDHLVWGNITGILSNQTDLQAALDGKLSVVETATYGPNTQQMVSDPLTENAAFSAGDVTKVSMASMNSGSLSNLGYASFNIDLKNFVGGASIGPIGFGSGSNRCVMVTYGTVTGYEFGTTPYVGANQIFHEGNLLAFTAADDGLTPASGGGTLKFLRADGTWAIPPGSGGGTTTFPVTFNTTGGAAAGTTFDGSVARTIDYSTVGAAKTGAITGSNLTMATSRVAGRATGGTGAVEELTLSQVLEFIGGATRGDFLYRGAASWARLPAGTTGQVLQTNGTGADPTWVTPAAGGGAWTVISTLTAGGASPTFDFTAIPATYRHLKIIGQGRTAKVATADDLIIQLNGDTTTANYQSQQLQGNGATASAVTNPATNNHFGSVAGASATANQSGLLEFLFPNYAGTTFIKGWQGVNSLPGFPLVKDLTGRWNVTTAINRITITAAANFVAGSEFTLYGIA
jgi:hypothetical protein